MSDESVKSNTDVRKGLRLLLTSAGVNNDTIRLALDDLLGKPIGECRALCIPTAMYGHPSVGPGVKTWEFISGNSENPMVELGWKSVGILELTALPSINQEVWKPLVQDADVLLVSGGDALYLSYWMKKSGMAELLPSLKAVYVGMSAGSMVMSPNIGEEFIGWTPPQGRDEALGLVDFSLFPHVDHEMLPGNTMSHAKIWASKIPSTGYAIDDQTAIKVVNGHIEVVSEGNWRLFN